jgi:hypothetical protein
MTSSFKVRISLGLFVQTKQAERWFRSCSSSARNRANATSCAVTLISHVNICRVFYYYLYSGIQPADGIENNTNKFFCEDQLFILS